LPSAAEIRRLQDAHERILDQLDERHSARLESVLEELEDQIEELIGAGIRSPEDALGKRVGIQAALQGTFLGFADSTVRDYDEITASVVSTLEQLALIEGFVPDDAKVITQLKRLSFAGYQDIANTYLNTLANGLYQNVVAGRPDREIIKEMRQAINGVYAKTDDAAAMELVEFVKRYKDNPRFADDVAEAVNKLHTIYARDRVGNNLRRYAYQQVHDAIMQFNGSFTKLKAQQAGLTDYIYRGSLVKDSRDWCISHQNRVMTEEEIREEWATRTWQGKAPGDPFIVRGGYNCRHMFHPVDPEWYGATA
jgi:hypothetical protein